MNCNFFDSNHMVFKYIYNKDLDKENCEEKSSKQYSFNGFRKSIKFEEEKNKQKKELKKKTLIPFKQKKKMFSSLKDKIKFKEENNEFHAKREVSKKYFKDRKGKINDSKSIFASKEVNFQLINGMLQ